MTTNDDEKAAEEFFPQFKNKVMHDDTLIAISDTKMVPFKELVQAWHEREKSRWREIAKEGLPPSLGYYQIIFKAGSERWPDTDYYNLELGSFTWVATEKVTHWSEIGELPE